MLEHLNSTASAPQRVVILGAGGFIGGACLERLRKESVPVLGLTRTEIDLLEEGATEKLVEHLLPSDALVVVSDLVPQVYYGCRQCYNLTYTSCRVHDKRIDALVREPERLEAWMEGDDRRKALLAIQAHGKLYP